MKPTRALLLSLFTLVLGTGSAHAFGPCSNAMPEGVSYQPSVKACGGKAAVVTWGKHYGIFSVVVRDAQNGDRMPCLPERHQLNSCATAQSSPYKVQRTVQAVIKRKRKSHGARIHCFKERGDSMPFKFVRRIAIKKRNPIRGDQDLMKICLNNRKIQANPLKIVSTGSVQLASNIGFNNACRTQKYMHCSEKSLADFFDSFND